MGQEGARAEATRRRRRSPHPDKPHLIQVCANSRLDARLHRFPSDIVEAMPVAPVGIFSSPPYSDALAIMNNITSMGVIVVAKLPASFFVPCRKDCAWHAANPPSYYCFLPHDPERVRTIEVVAVWGGERLARPNPFAQRRVERK